jgi:thiol:disulfide interchange protein DsbD
MKHRALITLSFLLCLLVAKAQLGRTNPVEWKITVKQIADNRFEVTGQATPEKGWHIYSAYLPENTAIPTSITINETEAVKALGKITETPEPVTVFDQSFQANLKWHDGTAFFSQKVEISKAGKSTITGHLEYMVCNDETCMPPDQIEFSFDVEVKSLPDVTQPKVSESLSTPAPDQAAETETGIQEETVIQEVTPQPEETETEQESYWSIFILAFFAGFAALLTPCVFPMIPMTVSFFTKQSKTKAQGFRNATIYAISIILIYVILGTLVTAVFGAGALNAMSSNPIFNLFFFILLIVFAISFLGAFEIVLPASWVNMADKNADKGGLIGIFFMAFTLALVSFSCTGPLVGTIIVEAARNGGMAPVIGMLGFSLALALPFAFFAAFPGYLNSLPKSGGWLNSVKVVLGFLELAFAFKFLSNADMALDLHILERETFLAIWIAVFGALALYLFGKIKLPHDSPMDSLPVSRLLLGITVAAFTIYMIPGLWGAPVKLISGFPPSSNYAESPMGVGREASVQATASATVMPEGMHLGPQGIPAFDDYHEALAYAKKVNKPLLLDFTGKTCVNCRKMEDNVWSDADIKDMLTNNYILVSLYVDLRKDLPENEVYVSKETGKKIKNVGQKWADFQLTRFHIQGQPYYVLLSPDETQIGQPRAFDLDVDEYKTWLKEGLATFGK